MSPLQENPCLAINVGVSQGSILGLLFHSLLILSPRQSQALLRQLLLFSWHLCTSRLPLCSELTVHKSQNEICTQTAQIPKLNMASVENTVFPMPNLLIQCTPVNGSTIPPGAQVRNQRVILDSSPCTVHYQFQSTVLSKDFLCPSSFLYLHHINLHPSPPFIPWPSPGLPDWTCHSSLIQSLSWSSLYIAARFSSYNVSLTI